MTKKSCHSSTALLLKNYNCIQFIKFSWMLETYVKILILILITIKSSHVDKIIKYLIRKYMMKAKVE